jgi:hypothetical protein
MGDNATLQIEYKRNCAKIVGIYMKDSGLSFLLSSYMEYSESIGFTLKILKIFFAQIMFFTEKKS